MSAETWTKERVDLLKLRWAEGLSASAIANELRGGVSRNAVIGKVHRLKLRGRAARQQQKSPRGPQAIRRSPRLPVFESLPMPPAGPDVGFLSLLELTEHTCKWPVGDPREDGFGFCGVTLTAAGSYCQRHAARAYTSAPALKPRVLA